MAKRILVLGAGLVTRPLIRYLLDQPGFTVTVATRTVSKAEAMLSGHPRGRAIALDAGDEKALEKLVAASDLTMSLLPWTMHLLVARACLDSGVHLVTTSYVRDEMKALDAEARAKGLLLLNECGLDPGIDHMSAMRIIHAIRDRGGRVTAFRSCCGGLPAPDANTNPWGYKFSWSPRGVVLAGRNPARYLLDGREVSVPGPELFSDVTDTEVAGVGPLEVYPNRDSLIYVDLYGLASARTLMRGTFRYRGHSRTWKALADLGWLDLEERDVDGTTLGKLQARLIGSPGKDVRAEVARRLGMAPGEDPMDRMAWLGLFGDEPASATSPRSPLDVLAKRLERKLSYAPGERDMIALEHRFEAEFGDGRRERIFSTLVDFGHFGEADRDTSMARTVSLPAAIAARLVLEGRITETGVHIPIIPGLYNPILDELEGLGLRFEDRTDRI